ncbi:MAG: hypothetical protein K2I47_03995, partial [Odoribacter sp.]|nr:hypothetical protein [Odoribacter sp.]
SIIMWKSIGDKFEIEPHDEQKHPRKVKTNTYLLFILILLFLITRYTVREKVIGWIGTADLYDKVVLAICYISTVSIGILFLLKYIKNSYEIDVALIIIFLCVY